MTYCTEERVLAGLSTEDCLVTLGLTGRVSRKEIKRAFRSRVRACHPDMHPDRPGAEAELKRVVRAYHFLNDHYSREHWDRLDHAFRASGHSHVHAPQPPARLQTAPVRPGVTRSVARGLAAGLLAALVYLAVSGGLASVGDTPAPGWSLAGLSLSGALIFGFLATALAGPVDTASFVFPVVLGLLLGAGTAAGYNDALNYFNLDPAKAWSLVALPAAGGLAAEIAILLRPQPAP